jgi:hypothetical protein
MTESTVRLPSRSGSPADMQGDDLADHTGSHYKLTGHVICKAPRQHQLATAGIYAHMGWP